LDGGLGAQHLNGGNGADALVGGPGDVLTGGNGGDVFVFNSNFGHNEITDFKNPDVIELAKSTFGSAANILAHFAVNDGHGNTMITDPHNSTNAIIIDHVGVNQLHASDFVLV
jgi:Ca2+-binding RTX toxin-like protein